MYRKIFLICLNCVALGASYNYELNLKPCREYDDDCVTEISRNIFAKVVKGVPEIGLKTADPMYQKHVDGDLALIKYTITNSTLVGLKGCDITRGTINLKKSILRLELACPHFFMVGNYFANGTIIIFPIEGDGRLRIEVDDYKVKIDIDTKFYNSKDGNRYLKFKSFRTNADLEGGMKFDLTNLFNGRKELGDPVLKFANQNWKPVSKELQGPVFNTHIKTLLKGFNKLLKHIPADHLLVEKY